MLLVAALLPVYHLCREATARLKLSVVAALLPAVLLLYFGSVRSQIFSFALFAVFYWVLSGYQRRKRNLLWTLPLMMILWVNLHGAFVLGIGLIVLFLIFFLVVAGFVRTLSKRVRLLHVYLVVCMGLYLFWLPGVSYDLFLMPLLPFLLVLLVSEFSILASIARRGWASSAKPQKIWGALITVVLSAVAGTTVHGYASGALLSLQSLTASASRASEDALAIDWIKEHTDTSETLVCYRDPKYFLYTGHKAVRSFPLTEGFSWEEDEVSIPRPAEAIFAIIDEADARYLEVTSTDFQHEVTSTDFQHEDNPERHRRTFGRLIEQHPSRFRVFESTEGAIRIYRTARNAG